MKKILKNEYFPFVIIGIGFFICMSRVELMTYADDVIFSTVLKRASDVFGYLVGRYATWTSRLSIEFFMTLIMRENLWIWRILNTCFFVLLVFGIYRISALNFKEIGYKLRLLTVFAIVAGLTVANFGVMEWSILWVTGSFHYLWPVALMVLTLYVPFRLFYGSDSPKRYALLYLPLILIFGLQEQTVLVFVAFLMISMIVYYVLNHKISYTGLWLLLPSVLCLIFIATCPGNSIRLQKEIISWYPNFGDLTISEKFFHGSSHTVFLNLLSDNKFLMVPLCLMIIYLILKYQKRIYLIILSFLPLIYIVGGAILKKVNWTAFYHSTLFNFQIIAGEKMAGAVLGEPHVSFYIGIFMVLLFPFFFYKIFGKSLFFLECLLLFGASIMSSLILSFSPTIFASGPRIFLVGNVMLVILLSRICLKAINMYSRAEIRS